MQGIGEFFKRIRGAQAREIFVRQIIQEAIQKHVGADIPLESIEFDGFKAVITGASPTLRSELFIKKTAILKDIAAKQSARKITDLQ